MAQVQKSCQSWKYLNLIIFSSDKLAYYLSLSQTVENIFTLTRDVNQTQGWKTIQLFLYCSATLTLEYVSHYSLFTQSNYILSFIQMVCFIMIQTKKLLHMVGIRLGILIVKFIIDFLDMIGNIFAVLNRHSPKVLCRIWYPEAIFIPSVDRIQPICRPTYI